MRCFWRDLAHLGAQATVKVEAKDVAEPAIKKRTPQSFYNQLEMVPENKNKISPCPASRARAFGPHPTPPLGDRCRSSGRHTFGFRGRSPLSWLFVSPLLLLSSPAPPPNSTFRGEFRRSFGFRRPLVAAVIKAVS